MQFEERPADHDHIFEMNGVRVFCDPKSYLYLNGLTLDYIGELMGGGFKLITPSNKRACACTPRPVNV